MNLKDKARERSEHYQARILAMLQTGPLSAMEIASRLNNEISITSTSMYLRAMAKEGNVCIERWERHPGADTYSIWAVANEQHRGTMIDRTLRISTGIDIADIDWMRFWRMPRSERRLILWEEHGCQ